MYLSVPGTYYVTTRTRYILCNKLYQVNTTYLFVPGTYCVTTCTRYILPVTRYILSNYPYQVNTTGTRYILPVPGTFTYYIPTKPQCLSSITLN